MRLHQKPPTSRNRLLQRHDLLNFVTTLYEGDLHAKRVLSLANATLGVLASASLAIHAVGRGLAQAMGTLTKHGVKQVDRLLSNRGVDVGTFFAYWTPYIVGARKEVITSVGATAGLPVQDVQDGVPVAHERPGVGRAEGRQVVDPRGRVAVPGHHVGRCGGNQAHPAAGNADVGDELPARRELASANRLGVIATVLLLLRGHPSPGTAPGNTTLCTIPPPP